LKPTRILLLDHDHATTMTSLSSALTLSNLLIVSALLRIALIIYSEWHDAHSVLKYTDVDYRVFSDATRFLLHPGTPEGNLAQGPLGRITKLGK
jgi:GPI mannosyltransferase 1 subunit M